MIDQPTQGNGPWYALLTGPDNHLIEDLDAALEKYGPETTVSIWIRRDETLPDLIAAGSPIPSGLGPNGVDDYDVDHDLLDEDGGFDEVRKMYAQAQAMAAGLNRAEHNDGDHDRSTDLAAALHDLADRLAAYEGAVPSYVTLDFVWTTRRGEDVDKVDALSQALFGQTGEPRRLTGGGWSHRAVNESGGLQTFVWTYIPAPAEEDPAALRAQIAELEQRLAKGGGAR